jgi:hypothetical protein
MDLTFDGQGWDSLVGNLRTVQPDGWKWVPPRGARTIRDIVRHIGGCKYMYENHVFGDGCLGWEDALVDGEAHTRTVEDAIRWLREGEDRLRVAASAMVDADLARGVRTNWGATEPAL